MSKAHPGGEEALAELIWSRSRLRTNAVTISSGLGPQAFSGHWTDQRRCGRPVPDERRRVRRTPRGLRITFNGAGRTRRCPGALGRVPSLPCRGEVAPGNGGPARRRRVRAAPRALGKDHPRHLRTPPSTDRETTGDDPARPRASVCSPTVRRRKAAEPRPRPSGRRRAGRARFARGRPRRPLPRPQAKGPPASIVSPPLGTLLGRARLWRRQFSTRGELEDQPADQPRGGRSPGPSWGHLGP